MGLRCSSLSDSRARSSRTCPVIDDYTAVAVENAPAGGDERGRFDAVGLGAFVVELRILHLQPPKPGYEHQKDGDRAVLEDGDFSGSEIRIVAKRGFIRELTPGFEAWVGRRKDHNKARKRLSLC